MTTDFTQINQALKPILDKMFRVLLTPTEIEQNYKKLSQIKKYDRLERRELMRQKYCLDECKQIQEDVDEEEEFDSKSDSDFDEDNYKNLDNMQMKYLIREKLVQQKLCPLVLEKVVLYDPQLDFKTQDDLQMDSVTDVNDDEGCRVNQGERMMNQVNKVLAEDGKAHKNLKALKFIIDELEKIQIQESKIVK